MHFKIIVSNGNFPLVYRCTTAYEAFGCIEALSIGLLHNVLIDMDKVMANLVRMNDGELIRFETHRYSVFRVNGEI